LDKETERITKISIFIIQSKKDLTLQGAVMRMGRRLRMALAQLSMQGQPGKGFLDHLSLTYPSFRQPSNISHFQIQIK
jgi:hypothetical protein